MEKEKVIVFGASEGGRNYKEKQIDYEILAFVDNDKNKQGTTLEQISIIAPEYMVEYDYDYIVIASVFYKEIKHQLLNEVGINPSKVKMAPKGLLKSSYRPFEDEETMKFARKSLLRVTKVFSGNNIKYFADFGTLLGIVREGDLISWDDDIDLSILMNDYDEVVSLFRNNIKDFEIDKDIECKVHVTHDKIRKEPINIGISFATNGNKVIRKFQINIGVVTIKDEFAVQSMNCSPKYHFEQQQKIDFWGEKISVPFEYESYLEFTYGDWKTPKINTSFEDYPLAFKDKVVSFREIIC
ncbi:LicD family protein [Sporosarcina sp. FSL K6-5500]|uniref:LicD family protein n=1 Tax=Sporosarcina sp. FSL K6-5500 TaxID=2921558 RepID=UPI0030F99D39